MEAFGRATEADLVDCLQRRRQGAISLVAEVGGELVGHVILTEATLMPTVPGLRMLGLGPVAVLPRFQRQGIGSGLIQHAIDQAGTEAWRVLVVVGHPDYYRRFGFGPASRFRMSCEFRVPEDAFMVLELQLGSLIGLRGVVRYQPEFSGL
jgi:putative acetyltransferase